MALRSNSRCSGFAIPNHLKADLQSARHHLLLAFFSLLLLAGTQTLAQTFPLQVQVSVMPPYSAYLQDYAGAGRNVRIFIINSSQTTYQVRLAGQLTGDNGVEIKTSPNYRPPRPLTVPPGQKLLTQSDLEGLFDLNQIEVTGLDKNRLAQGLPLPDGAYQLCIRAYNEGRSAAAGSVFGQPLSAELPLGCSAPILVRAVEPPILIAPLCDANVIPTQPQATVFTWTPPVGVSPAQVEYSLRIVELPHNTVDPNVFIDAVNLPKSGVEIRNLKVSTFLYGPTQPPLTVGKRYAWRVQAIDLSKKLNFLNDGKSPVCAFTYGEETKVETPIVKLAPPTKATKVGMLVFCDQMFMVDKVTNDDLDHFSGTGSLNLKLPGTIIIKMDFKDLVVRPLEYTPGTYADTQGFHYWEVVKGKVETSIEKILADKKSLLLKTDPHTGGTAEVSYQAVRLEADQTAVFNEQKNAYDIQPGGLKKAEIQGGVTWNSPMFVKPAAGKGTANANGELVVTVAGEWFTLPPYGKAAESNSNSGIKMPIGKAIAGNLTELTGFQLSLEPSSYFTVANGVLSARLTGSLTVPSGRSDTDPIKINFTETNGLAFNTQLEDQQLTLADKNNKAIAFLSFSGVNVKLADLYEADDLPWPTWVKGISTTNAQFWLRVGSPGKPSWATVPVESVYNRGEGFQNSKAQQKKISVVTTYEGFKAKLTNAVISINKSQLSMATIEGQAFIPFIGSVANILISINKNSVVQATASISSKERTLLETPEGDIITVSATDGYFEEGYFYPTYLSFSAYNKNKSTRGLNAKNVLMDQIDAGINPEGKIVSDYMGTKAEALFNSKQQTAYINGLDYHLARVILTEVNGGKDYQLSFNGKLVLGEKIVSPDQYLFDVSFKKPSDEFAFAEDKGFDPLSPVVPTKVPSTIPAPTNTNKANTKIKSGGAFFRDLSWVNEAQAGLLGYVYQPSAPASTMVLAAKSIKGEFSTGTANFVATFTYYTDDATFGDGFRAETNMSVTKPVAGANMVAKIIAGKKSGVKYWFAGFKYENQKAPGIPLFLNLEAYGFEGRIYSHMAHNGGITDITNDNYVPNTSTKFGLYASLPIRTSADNGRLLWGKTAVEIICQGWTPSEILIRGDANVEQVNGTGDSKTSRIQGYANIRMGITDKTLTGEVVMTKADFGVACGSGSANFYFGPSGFALAAGSPGAPIQVKAFCGALGDLTPSAAGYVAIYAKDGSIGGMEWLPNGIGIHGHLTATLINLDSRNYVSGDFPWAKLLAKADADMLVTIRPNLLLKGSINTVITLDVGYSDYSTNLANVAENIQIMLPDPVCLSYNKRICFPIIGGANVILGIRNLEPIIKTNGGPGDMCFDDGSVSGPCEGLLGWVADGVQYIVDTAGKVAKKAAELADDACDYVCPWRW